MKEKNHEEFSIVVKNITDSSEVINNKACANLLLKNQINLQLCQISLHFFLFLVDKFTLLDPDLGEKMNVDPCGSGSTALAKRMHTFLYGLYSYKNKLLKSENIGNCSYYTCKVSRKIAIFVKKVQFHTGRYVF